MAKFVRKNGHWLSDKFDARTPTKDADLDYVHVAINAASAFERQLEYKSCGRWATFLRMKHDEEKFS